MECKMSTNDYVHWYKHLPGEPPKRILYMSGQTPYFDDSGDRSRFQVWKHPTELLYRLTIDVLTPRDSGTYYCAYWRYQGITASEAQRRAVQKGILHSEPQALNSAKNADTSLFHPPLVIFCSRVGKTALYRDNCDKYHANKEYYHCSTYSYLYHPERGESQSLQGK